MWRNAGLLIAVAMAGTTWVSFSWGAPRDSGLLGPDALQRAGLERMWFSQVSMDGGRSRLAFGTLHVSRTQGHTEVAVTTSRGERFTFSERQRDLFGREIGVEGVQRLADEKLAELRAVDPQATLTKQFVPLISLYVATDRGVIHAFDAETGQTRWVNRAGGVDNTTMAPAASDQYVAVISGVTLSVLDAVTGKLLMTRETISVPGAGAAVGREHIMVPMIDGKLESYDVRSETLFRSLPFTYQCFGRNLVSPLVTARSVTWPSDKGYLYVANVDSPRIRFRLEAKKDIISPITYLPPNRFLGASLDGYVYCIGEANGDLLWQYSTGERINQSAIPFGKFVYVVTDVGMMYCISAERGEEQWRRSNVEKVVAGSGKRVYVLNDVNRLSILDAATGSEVGDLPTEGLRFSYSNTLTDRILLATTTGLIQCLRETDQPWPLVHAGLEAPPPPPVQQPAAVSGAPSRSPEAAAPPAGGEPVADPFGAGGAAPAAGAADPFAAPAGADPFGGGAADPFGTPAAATAPSGSNPAPAGGDPFGGAAADPFGGAPAAGAAGDDPFK